MVQGLHPFDEMPEKKDEWDLAEIDRQAAKEAKPGKPLASTYSITPKAKRNHWRNCVFADDCERQYCSIHRLLYRDCDTAVQGIEGDRDVINGTRLVWEKGDCPECQREREYREFLRRKAQYEREIKAAEEWAKLQNITQLHHDLQGGL